jgi:hypothetical protein
MTGTHQVPACILDRSNQITEALIGHSRDERKRQLPGGEQTRKADRVTPIGLHTVTRTPRDRPRRDDTHIDPTLPGRASQAKPCRPRLIHSPHRPQIGEKAHNLARVDAQLAHLNLACHPVQHRRMRLRGMNIQTNQPHTLHRSAPPIAGVSAAGPPCDPVPAHL